MKSFDKWFNEQRAPEPAKPTPEEIEDALPYGFYMRGNTIMYECVSCGNEREWYGDDPPEDVSDRLPCGGTQYCIP